MRVFNIYSNIIKLSLLSLLLLVSNGCKDDFFDINADPNSPTTAQLSQLLTNSEIAIAEAVGMGTSGLSAALGVYTHQVTRRAALDRYNIQGNDFLINASWQLFYDIAFQDLRVMIDQGTAEDNMVYVGIAKLLKAYSYSIIVDVWGDVPFSEATQFPDISFPRFDDDATIYPALLDMIDEGIADMNNADAANTLVPGSDDVIYGGSVAAWQRFGKTLKLRMLNQVRGVGLITDAEDQIRALMMEGDLIDDNAQDFQLLFGPSQNPENRHPAFVSDYASANPIYYISIWFHQIMTGQNENIFTGLDDPRRPYYYTNQLTPGEAAQNPAEYIEDDGFLSIFFGSSCPNQAGNQASSQAAIGIFPCGGWYDDGSGRTVNNTAGTGVVPERMLTNITKTFIEAELALAGVIDGDPKALLEEGILASFDKVNEVVAGTGTTQVVPTLESDSIYVAAVLDAFDAGSQERKLEIILTQKWIANFGHNIDAYNDIRRTGYPKFMTPIMMLVH